MAGVPCGHGRAAMAQQRGRRGQAALWSTLLGLEAKGQGVAGFASHAAGELCSLAVLPVSCSTG